MSPCHRDDEEGPKTRLTCRSLYRPLPRRCDHACLPSKVWGRAAARHARDSVRPTACTFAVHVLMLRIMFDDGGKPLPDMHNCARVRPTAEEERTLRHRSKDRRFVSPWPSSTVATVNTAACVPDPLLSSSWTRD
jgi:hypothetical protein